MRFSITSPAFEDQGIIPAHYTCDGTDISPPLNWSGAPDETQSLALIMDDPDAPDPADPKMTWVHWLLYNLPPNSDGLPEAAQPDDLPDATLEGINNWGRTHYGGPCPPIGRHRYFFKLYALDQLLPDLNHPDKDTLLTAIQGHVLAKAVLMATYQHGDP